MSLVLDKSVWLSESERLEWNRSRSMEHKRSKTNFWFTEVNEEGRDDTLTKDSITLQGK